MQSEVELSVVLPCLNEIETLAKCINKAKECMERLGVVGEVIVADNGSTDGSIQVAESNGALVVHVLEKGYGSALMGGITAAQGKFVIMGDADDSYSLDELDGFIESLRAGNDLVMGNRFGGVINKGAMPFLHKWLGNPVLSFLGRLFFKSDIRDFHCGLRGFNTQKIIDLNLQTTGMEFASELVVKSLLADYKVTQVPTNLQVDGRSRAPHLRTWRDGWRHLRFLLSYSPRWLFLYPGLFMLALGLPCTLILTQGDVHFGRITFSSQTLILTTFLVQIGVQLIWFSILSKASSTVRGFLPIDIEWKFLLTKLQRESNYIAYLILIMLGAGMLVYQMRDWIALSFGDLTPRDAIARSVLGVLLISTGLQSLVSQFLLNIVTLNWQPSDNLEKGRLRTNH
jgi:glycosyltransferase involved in cell wall biosynthesis